MSDGPQIKLLVVTDSRTVQQSISTGAARWCQTIVCEDPATLPEILTSHPGIAAAMVDQPMAKGNGLTVLEYLQRYRPLIRRILLATPNDLSAAVAALHRGSAQHVAYVPVSPAELESMLGPLQTAAARPPAQTHAPAATRTEPLYPAQAFANSLNR